MAEPPSSSEEESVCHQLQLRAFRRLLPASSPVAALPLSGSLTSPLPGKAAGRGVAALAGAAGALRPSGPLKLLVNRSRHRPSSYLRVCLSGPAGGAVHPVAQRSQVSFSTRDLCTSAFLERLFLLLTSRSNNERQGGLGY